MLDSKIKHPDIGWQNLIPVTKEAYTTCRVNKCESTNWLMAPLVETVAIFSLEIERNNGLPFLDVLV